jgi:hypothetical protein
MQTYTIITCLGAILTAIGISGVIHEVRKTEPPISIKPETKAIHGTLPLSAAVRLPPLDVISVATIGAMMIQPPDGPKIEQLMQYLKNFAPNATVLLENGRLVVDDGIKRVAFDFPK